MVFTFVKLHDGIDSDRIKLDKREFGYFVLRKHRQWDLECEKVP